MPPPTPVPEPETEASLLLKLAVMREVNAAEAAEAAGRGRPMHAAKMRAHGAQLRAAAELAEEGEVEAAREILEGLDRSKLDRSRSIGTSPDEPPATAMQAWGEPGPSARPELSIELPRVAMEAVAAEVEQAAAQIGAASDLHEAEEAAEDEVDDRATNEEREERSLSREAGRRRQAALHMQEMLRSLRDRSRDCAG